MMIFKTLAAAVAFGGAMAASASAAVVVLDFEGAGDQTNVLDFYNGGTDSAGNAGTNYGIEFSSNALSIIDSDAGGTGNFANEPSAETILFWLSGGSAIMNVAAGFVDGFSFFYSSSTAAVVNVWSGLNATGDLLATINLSANFNNNCSGDPNGAFCHWDPIGVAFAGTAMSVDFGGTINQTGYDNITFGSDIPSVGEVPLPGAVLFLATGLIGLGGVAKRRRKALA